MNHQPRIRFATIGTNFITDTFIEAAGACEALTYEVAYSRDGQKAQAYAREKGARRWCDSLEALAADPEVDAVYIASPNSLHHAQAAMMLASGKHVLCEKTITSNSRELSHLMDLAKANQVVLLEGMRSVHDPGFQALVDALPHLGTLRRVSFQYCQYSSRYDKFKEGIVENAFNPALSNGALMDIGVYCVHPLVALFGEPESILSDVLFLHNGVDGAGTILAHYPGMQAELTYAKIADGRIPSQIQGEAGTMTIENIAIPKRLTIHYRDGRKEEIILPKEKNNMVHEVRVWAALIAQGAVDHPYLKASQQALALMDAVRRQQHMVFPADA